MSLELAYTQTQDPSTSSSLQITLNEVMLIHTSTKKTLLLNQSQMIFEQGGMNGRLLGMAG